MTNWIIPCSPSIYDAEGAFRKYKKIVWHQDCKMEIGDIVYVYITAPVKAIKCKCVVTDANIPLDTSEDVGYVKDDDFCSRSYSKYMELTLVEEYDNPSLYFWNLIMNGLNGTIRSQRRISDGLASYIVSVTK